MAKTLGISKWKKFCHFKWIFFFITSSSVLLLQLFLFSFSLKGGYDGMKNLSTVEMYNPETNEWSFVASMEKHEGGVGVGVIPMDE